MRVKLGQSPDGEALLPAKDLELLGRKAGESVELLTLRSAGSMVMSIPEKATELAFFSGSLATLSIAEVAQLVFGSLKTGILSMHFIPDRRKTIYFQSGAVVFASSTDVSDRLGSVLLRQGKVKPQDIVRCGQLVKPGKPLGQILVSEKLLTAAELYGAVAAQVREIFLSSFVETGGYFVFVEGEFEERSAVKLPERTRELLLEGVKRIDEMDRIGYETVPDREAVMIAKKGAQGAEGRETRLLDLVDGKKTVNQIIGESHLGLYDGLNGIAALVKKGAISAKAAPEAAKPAAAAAPEPEAPKKKKEAEEEVFSISTTTDKPAAPAKSEPKQSGPFETYRRIIQRVYEALAAAQPDAAERLNSYFDRLPEKQRPIFDGVRIEPDGEIDVAQVHLNVTASGAYKGAAARARALEALEAFVSFAVFEAKNSLDKAALEKLLREVGKMQVGKL